MPEDNHDAVDRERVLRGDDASREWRENLERVQADRRRAIRAERYQAGELPRTVRCTLCRLRDPSRPGTPLAFLDWDGVLFPSRRGSTPASRGQHSRHTVSFWPVPLSTDPDEPVALYCRGCRQESFPRVSGAKLEAWFADGRGVSADRATIYYPPPLFGAELPAGWR